MKPRGDDSMKPVARVDSGRNDLFRSRLDQIVDMNHALAKLARQVDWGFLEKVFGAVYKDGPGHPPLPTRLMAGLAILKHTNNLSERAAVRGVGRKSLLPAVLRRGVFPP